MVAVTSISRAGTSLVDSTVDPCEFDLSMLTLRTLSCHTNPMAFKRSMCSSVRPVGACRKAEMKEGGALIIICYNKLV